MPVTIVSGLRKRLFDAWLFLRVAAAGVGRFGPLGLVREFRAYLRDNRNLFSDAADRYVRRGPDTYAAGALPPLGSRAFRDYLFEEVETFNRKRLSPMVFALVSASSRCPYRCPYCYALDDLRPDEAVPVEALARTVGDLASVGLPTICLTGGEVMMRRDDLPAIAAPLRGTGTALFLVTSGWGITRESLAPLLDCNLRGLTVSLDSRHPDRAIAAKGHPDAFRNALDAIAAARDLGLLVSVDCVATPDLLDPAEYRAFLEFLADQGVHFVNFLAPHKTGGVVKNDFPTISTAQFQALEALMSASNRGAANRRLPLAYSPMVWEHRRGCVAGQQFLYVNPLGEIRPCPFLVEPLGRITDESVLAILARMRGGGERCGCFSLYEGLPARTRLGGLPKQPA